MFEILIKGFPDKNTAQEFINWYNIQGRQFITDWLECRSMEGRINARRIDTDNSETEKPTWKGNQLEVNIKITPADSE